ncbi:MAG: hemolysin family protein [Clostridiales bacterium]|nr:hemolysin family protein [Clostridiales bacterium]
MTLYVVIAGIVLCIFLSYCFSSSEMAFSSSNLMRIRKLSENGNRKAKRAKKLIENFDDTLGTILIGNNLVNIASSSLASVLVVLITGGDGYAWIATTIITVLVIIFGETIPKILAKKNANRMALGYSGFINLLNVVLHPFVWLVVKIIDLITKGIKSDVDERENAAIEELQTIVRTAEQENVLEKNQALLIQSSIDFADIYAFEAMTARVDIVSIDIDDDWDEIVDLIENTNASRIPVYEDSIDNIIGILYVNHFLKALTEADGPFDLKSILLTPCYVYKTTKLPSVLTALRKDKQQLAIVSDEYGGTMGVISLEDVMEQIVGEIWDETDTVKLDMVLRPTGEYEVNGDMVIADFLEIVGIDEDDFDFESETVGGWALESLHHYPKRGESFKYQNLLVKILAMDGRRVKRLLIKINNK